MNQANSELVSDEELVRAAQGGDRAALEELFARHYNKIYSVCRRMAGNEEDALDAAQEAFLAIVKNLAKFSGEAAFGTWAYRIATNACYDELSKRKRRPLLAPTEEGYDPPSKANAPEDVATAKVEVQAALECLPEEYRIAVVLRDQCDWSYQEISEMLEVPVGTVRSRIARGRAELVGIMGTKPQHAKV